MGGPDGKIFGSRSGRTDRAQRGPCVLTESQIFSRPARPYSVNKPFIIWPLFCIFIFWVERDRARQHCFVSRAFLKSQWSRAIHLVSLWSVLEPQVVYKLKNTNILTKVWSNPSHFGKCHLNLLQLTVIVKKKRSTVKNLHAIFCSNLLRRKTR